MVTSLLVLGAVCSRESESAAPRKERLPNNRRAIEGPRFHGRPNLLSHGKEMVCGTRDGNSLFDSDWWCAIRRTSVQHFSPVSSFLERYPPAGSPKLRVH